MKEKEVLKELLKNNPKLIGYVLEGDCLITSEVLHAEDFSRLPTSSKLLVKIGRNLFNGEGHISLFEVANNLDDSNYANFLNAMALYRK